ncbi:TPA: restriction endonuclease subunit S [Vibrio cholerae]|uniref:restriction endonuclease subunit S n=1 Tax=Vibrio cholerae TaxID=666 RepID=UPI002080748B|nr:restriction endonuclease subunit S [Vibrio cholerae]ELE5878148.1 restriction endonuclease subunit S [Vibrio cholerae]MDV2387819.1 restriction endonuclease subunit S [Vibrio cholerae]GHZ42335.1 restriction endonuclease subunit S [Vibrio cholerae]HDZ9246968.1 restriction endonuclease subunit S [Vibrio cholerae]
MSLPLGWEIKLVNEINQHKGKTIKPSDFPDEIFELYSVPSFPSDKPELLSGDKIGSAKQMVEPGDVLVCKINPRINRVWIVGTQGAYRQIASSEWINVRNDTYDSNYLRYFFSSQGFRELLCSEVTGVGGSLTRAQPKKVAGYPVIIAPPDQQTEIANQLDLIFEKLKMAQSRLEKVPLLLKRFRMSVLSAAVSGELTEEWRDANNADDWEHVSLKQVGKGFNYGSSAKSKKEGSVPVLRMGNLQDGKLDWSDLVYTSDESEIEKYKLEPGDVLFNRTNSPELVGKTSIYRGEREAIFAGYLIKVQGTERLNSEYLNIQLNSPNARDYCWQVKTDGVSQSNINAQKLKAYEFNLPSIEEQEEIVRVVSELLAKSDLVKKQYEAAKLRVDKLTQSILALAFRGELFEPFSDKAERVAQPQSEGVIDEQPTDREETTLEQADINSIQSRPTPKTVDDKSELLSQLKSAKKAMTAQQLFDSASVETFKAIDELFVELKRLLELNLIEKMGEGENCQFKATK